MLAKILVVAIPVVVVIAVILILMFVLTKTAEGNEALVVSGVGATDKNGNPTIKRAGGRVVIPFIQKAKYFDLCVRTAKVSGDVTKTQTGVPVRIDWAVAYNPDISSQETLQKAVFNFLDKNDAELERVILDVVSGGVRAVIAKMTPEEVMKEKDKLDDEVKKSIDTQMRDLGFNIILSIHEVEDAPGSTFLQDLSARDREGKRRDAANVTAEAEQSIREKHAETDKVAKEKELETEVAIAERQRDADVKKAQFQAETAREQAKSEMAGELQKESINQELEEKKGAVAVTQAEQANLAALKQQQVEVTKAETDKKKIIIKAEAEAEEQKARAKGEAEASAVKRTRTAEAEAEARKTEAEGVAEARKTEAAADAEAITVKGKAEADAIEAKGIAEAAAIEAKGKAEAEAARALSDAQAANDKVNFELKKIEIEQNTRVQVATNVATVMAEVGKNAKFYDFGGSSKQEGNGDLLTGILGRIPQLFAQADMQNQALNGEEITDTVRRLVSSIAEPIKGQKSIPAELVNNVTDGLASAVDSEE